MKIRHNKKRNTAFIYEALIVESTVSALKKDTQRQNKAAGIIRKHFKNGNILRKDLECYRALYEKQGIDSETSRRILKEATLQQKLIDPDGLFKAQTEIINDINKELDPQVFNNFVPNYKSLATIAQLFSDKTAPKTKIVLENKIINDMKFDKDSDVVSESVDNILISKFVEKFNDKYTTSLLDEQKELLSYYITSFVDNALELKVFLNEELPRLKNELSNATDSNLVNNDPDMVEKKNKIIEKIESFSNEDFNDDMLLTILKTQSLVKEINSDGD